MDKGFLGFMGWMDEHKNTAASGFLEALRQLVFYSSQEDELKRQNENLRKALSEVATLLAAWQEAYEAMPADREPEEGQMERYLELFNAVASWLPPRDVLDEP